jgi:anti-sigma regulatory factor (Ser/Thr protein kinase)
MWSLSKHSRQMALQHSQLQSVMQQRTAELQSLSQRLLKVQDEERRKLSCDVHDSTGQTLAALDHAIEEIRIMSYHLHPPLLDKVGFAGAAEWYVEGFAKRTRVNVKLDIANAQERLPIGIEIALFRVLQESLTNVHRHSGASEVSVCFHPQLEKIVLEIRDDGSGIPAERLARLCETGAETGVGLAGMRERMNELNGKLEIESDSQGTTMRAIIPRSATTLSGPLGDRQQVIVSAIPRGSQPLPARCICNRPVLLGASKADEFGQAVHEGCYVLKLRATAECLNDGASTPASANKDVIQPRRATMPKDRPKQPDALATLLMQPWKSFPWHKRPWNGGLEAIVTVLLLACWIAYGDRHPLSFLGPLELQRMAAIEEQVPSVPAENRPRFRASPIAVGDARTATLPHGVVLVTKVVHIGQDVIVRYFPPEPAPHRESVGQYQRVDMGEDVTVRYFAPVARNTRN